MPALLSIKTIWSELLAGNVMTLSARFKVMTSDSIKAPKMASRQDRKILSKSSLCASGKRTSVEKCGGTTHSCDDPNSTQNSLPKNPDGIMSIDHTCLAMTRKMPGLHEGVNLRAEKNRRGGWSFEMRMRPLGAGTFWYEHTPDGQWISISS